MLDPSNAAMAAGTTPRETDWDLDVLGNWSGESPAPGHLLTNPSGPGSGTISTNQQVFFDNRIQTLTRTVSGSSPVTTEFVYDPSGNLVCDGDYFYQYDGLNRLMQVSPKGTLTFSAAGVPAAGNPGAWLVSYTYDGLGRLVRKLSPWPGMATLQRTEHFYYDGIRRISETITDPLFATDDDPVDMAGEDDLPPQQYSTVTDREYVWGPGGVDELVCQIYDSGARAYALLDIGGNVAGLVNATGGIIEQYVYDPYGQALLRETPGGHDPRNRIGHKGLFFDRLDAAVTTPQLAANAFGLYQNRNRTYAPGIGRFLQRDPNASGTIVLETYKEPNHQAAVAQLLQLSPSDLYRDGLSLYSSFGANPVLNSDPLGLFFGGFVGLLGSSATMSELQTNYAQDVVEGGLSVRDALRNSLGDYGIDQMMDQMWALDWGADDSDFSRAAQMRRTLSPADSLRGRVFAGRVPWNAIRKHHLITRYGAEAKRFKRLLRQYNLKLDDVNRVVDVQWRYHKGRGHSTRYHDKVFDILEAELKKAARGNGDYAAAVNRALNKVERLLQRDPGILRRR